MNSTIRGYLRERLGADPDDSSKDEEIAELSPAQQVRHLSGWLLGDPAWADNFAHWMRECDAKPGDFN